MATHLRSTLVGVFSDRTMAEQTVEALEDAGFDRDQIWYSSPGGTSRFFEDIKSLFTGAGTATDNLVNEFTGMGLSEEEARYYANEYNNGRSVVAVKAPDRAQEAMTLLHRFGAYNYQPATTPGDSVHTEQAAVDYMPPAESAVERETAVPTSQEAAPEVQQPAPTTYEPVSEVQQPATVTHEPAHPAEEDHPQEPETTIPPEPITEEPLQDSQHVSDATAGSAEYEAPPALESQPTTTTHEPVMEHVASPAQPAPPPAEPVDHEMRMQEIQRQIQEAQQQLEEVRARLQAAKEREGQFRDAQKQLQDLRDQLQAAMDELHQTEENIARLSQ